MKRPLTLFPASLVLVSLAGCLPDNFFPNLLGASVAEVWSVVLSDLVNTFLPLP